MKKITNHLKYLSKVSALFFFNLFKVYFLGSVSTITVLFLGLYLLSQSTGDHSGHAGIVPFLITSVITRPFSSIIFYLLIIIVPYFTTVFAMKYALSKVISKLLKDHTQTIIIPFIDKVFDKFKKNQPDKVRSGADYALAKINLLNEFKNSSENRILKIVMLYALKKINIKDINPEKENLSFYELIKTLILQKLNELAEPGMLLFYTLLAAQWLSLVLIKIGI